MTAEANHDPDLLAAGTVLPDGHRIVELLTRGRLGFAYVVESPDGKRRAATVLHAELTGDLGDWFATAARVREDVVHPHLARTFNVDTLADGRLVEVAELLEGETLRDALSNRSVPLPLAVVARILREVASAIDHLHDRQKPIVHRCLTPENVLLTAPDGVVKLLGVGEVDRPRFEATRASYQSPEELAELTLITPRADLFVLGSLAYEALTGHPAFTGTPDMVLTGLHRGERPDVTQLRPDAPAAANKVLQRAWDLHPDRRHTNAMEFARALSEALGVPETSETLTPTGADPGSVAVRVMHRRSALLGPTVETDAPQFSRSFLDRVEQTEVSIPPRPERKAPAAALPRAQPSPRVASSIVRTPVAPVASQPVEAGDEPTPRVLDAAAAPVVARVEAPREQVTSPGIATPEPPAPARNEAPVAAPTPDAPPAPVPAPTTSPFRDDPRTTLDAPVATIATAEAPSVDHAARTPPPAPATLPGGTAHVTRPLGESKVTPQAAPVQASLPSPTPSPTAIVRVTPQPVSPPPDTSSEPHNAMFVDEPTATIRVKPDAASLWRSPLVVASIFIANAIVIVGVAHAIALVANRSPNIQFVSAPAPVCAPCAPCPPARECPAVSAPVPATPRTVAPRLAPMRAPAQQR